MSVRRLLAGVATTSIVATALAVAAPAQADPTAGYVPSSADIIGAGSDTSEFALNYLADGNAGVAGYNATSPANKLVSWNALPPAGAPATINLPGQPRGHPPQRLRPGQGVPLRRRQRPRDRLRPVVVRAVGDRGERRPLRLPVRPRRARPGDLEGLQRPRDPDHRGRGQDLQRPGDQLERARRCARRDRADGPAERLGHAVLLRGAAQGRQRWQPDLPPDAGPGPGARPVARQGQPQRRGALLHRPQRRVGLHPAHRGWLQGPAGALQRRAQDRPGQARDPGRVRRGRLRRARPTPSPSSRPPASSSSPVPPAAASAVWRPRVRPPRSRPPPSPPPAPR